MILTKIFDILLIAFSLLLIFTETHFYIMVRTVIALKKVKGEYTNHLSDIEREMQEFCMFNWVIYISFLIVWGILRYSLLP